MSRIASRLLGSLPARTPRRRRWAVAALAIASVAALPAPASAKEYTVAQCRTAGGEAVKGNVSPFMYPVVLLPVDRCLTGGGLNFEMTGTTNVPAGWQLGFSYSVPPSLPNTTMTWASALMSVTGKTGGPAAWVFGANGNRLRGTEVGSGTWPGIAESEQGAELPPGTKSVAWVLACVTQCQLASTTAMAVKRVLITLDDPTPPVAATPEGEGLLDGSAQRGSRTFRVDVSDADSGVHHIELRHADGRLLGASQPTDCEYIRPDVCPQSRAGAELQVDTTKLANGRHTVELRTFDAAGNETVTPVGSVTVSNPAATPTPVPTVVATPAPIAIPTPTPATGATPTPTIVPSSTVGPTPAASVGPSPPSGSATPAAEPKAEGLVSRVTFKVSARAPRAGSRVVLSGVVSPVPAGVARLLIEARSGKRWITAAVVRTRKGGTFTWSHRFRKRATFTMRARLLSTVGTKQKPAVSPERTFRVR